MDCLAALAFGITVITAIRNLGFKNEKEVAITTIKSGLFGILGIAIIYIGLIWLGATSLHDFKLSSNGGTALAQISHYYLGTVGDDINCCFNYNYLYYHSNGISCRICTRLS